MTSRRAAGGLLLIRIAMAATLACGRPTTHHAELIPAVLLLGGIWTPAAAVVVAVVESWRVAFLAGGWASVLLATLAVALVLIGPGTWSIDGRIPGWRRIDIPRASPSGERPPIQPTEGGSEVSVEKGARQS